MNKAVFYHAGCPVCVEAERNIATALDASKYEVEVVHLGEEKGRIFLRVIFILLFRV
jgi:hydrogenase maturation factor